MQVYLVSVRTAIVYGPGEILEAQNPHGNFMTLSARWEHNDHFDEWEGYAVVVPERNQVWGLTHPQLEEQVLKGDLNFAPQPIPPKDKKLFAQKMKQANDPAKKEESED